MWPSLALERAPRAPVSGHGGQLNRRRYHSGPHPSMTAPPHHHEPCLALVCQPDECCVRPPLNTRCGSRVFAPSPRMRSVCPSNHERTSRLARSKAASQPSHISGPRCGTYRSVCMGSLYTLGVRLQAAAYPSLPPVATTRMATATSRVMSCTTRSFT